MRDVINKTVKYMGMWAEDASRLKRLSQETGWTQVAVAHDALVRYEEWLAYKKWGDGIDADNDRIQALMQQLGKKYSEVVHDAIGALEHQLETQEGAKDAR